MIEIIALVLTVLGFALSYPSIKKQWVEHRSIKLVEEKSCTLERVLQKKILRVGCIPYPPFIHYVRKGVSIKVEQGFYKTLLERLADDQGLEIEYVAVRNDKSLKYLNSNKVDLIACLLRTPERIRQADFAATLHTISINGVARKDELRIQKKIDLKKEDIKIAAVEGECGQEALVDYGISVDNSGLQLIETDDVSSIFKMVSANLADVAISDGLACLEYLERSNDENLQLLFEDEPILVVPCGLMIRQGDVEFKQWLGKQVSKARQHKTVVNEEQILLNKYGRVLHQM